VRDPQEGRPHLHDARTDWLQRKYLAARHPLLARPLLGEAERKRRFNDYLAGPGPGVAAAIVLRSLAPTAWLRLR